MGGYCSDGDPVLVGIEKRVVIEWVFRGTCGDCGCDLAEGLVRDDLAYGSRQGPPVPGDLLERDIVVEMGIAQDGETWCLMSCVACQAVLQELWSMGAECLHRGGLKDYLRDLDPWSLKGLPDHPFVAAELARQETEYAS